MSNLVNVVVNDWGETTYEPTTLGKVLLAVVIIALFAAGIAITKSIREKSDKKNVLTVKQIAVCAMSVALGMILTNIKLFKFPTGGSITLLSMLVICLPGYFYGVGVGIITGVAYGVLKLMVNPYVLFPMQLVIDYLLAFGALGLSGVFRNAKYGLQKGYVLGVLGRYVFCVLSGWIFFGEYAWEGWSPLGYSMVYNAIYIFAECILTVAVLFIPAVKNAIERIKRTVVE